MTEQILKNFENTHQKIAAILTDYVTGGYVKTLSKLLVYIGQKQAEEALLNLPEPVQSKVREAYKNLSGKKITDPEIVAEAMRVLKDSGFFGKTLCASVSENLNSSQKDELLVSTNELFEKDPLIAMCIEKNLFTFDMISNLDDRSIQKILQETARDTLAIALKNAPENIQEKIFRNMSKRAANSVKEDMEFFGPVRPDDVNAARDEMIKTVIALSGKGEIVVSSYWE